MTETRAQRLDALNWSLQRHADAATAPVDVESWEVPGEPVAPETALPAARFRPAEVGDAWGSVWGTTWWRFTGRVPAAWAGRRVELHVDLGFSFWPPGFQAEGLVVDAAGGPRHGLHPRQQRHLVSAAAEGGAPVEVLVEAAANPSVTSFTAGGADDVNRGDGPSGYRLTRAVLAVADPEVQALAAELDVLRTLLAVAEAGGTSPRRREQVEAACDDVARLLGGLGDGPGPDPALVRAARDRLRPVLAAPAAADAPALSLVGHAHLDTAWLWPVRETVRKAVRTYANVVALMADDPDLTFAGSQAAQHAWVEQRHPALFARVVERAREGRWVPVGGMWVEADVLLPSGESLARQLVHGQRYFLDRFGRAARTGWLPDCFGYSPALPQLLLAAGVDGFVTQKLSWNDTNRFPHRTFWWEGLDGSRVLTHFPAVNTYNAELSANDVVQALAPDASGVVAADSLAPLGYGDGGGGPTAPMLAKARLMRDVEGLPRTRFVDPDAFMAGLRDPSLPTWRGDLYLETHRGVWTSQRGTKLGDARGDEALRDAETWCATATVVAGVPYPYDELDGLWRRHLLLEFHDILPGTSITRVHREAEAEHAAVLAAALALRDAALRVLGGRAADRPVDVVRPAPGPGGSAVLDNGLLRVVVGRGGGVTSLVDLRTGRDVVAPGADLGALHLHEDRPTVFDAWNLDRSYLDTRLEPSADGLDIDDAGVSARVAFGDSVATLRWSLPADAAEVGLRIDVDWRERDRILKLAFPFDLAAAHVHAGVQHGVVARSLEASTSWEQARYEDWFHGFLHLRDDAAGMGVVTAGAHGYDGARTTRPDGGATATLRCSLLRGPRFPDPTCDLGHHRIDVALLAGTDLEPVARRAREVRAALVPPAAAAGLEPLVAVAGYGVALDAVKLADDRGGDVVVRLHEHLGHPARATVRTAAPVVEATRCDLLERPVAPAERTDGGPVPLALRPFELVTLRLRR